MIRSILIICSFCLLATFTGAVLPVCGQETDLQQEYKIKAAFLLNFPKFIRWPQSSGFAESNSLSVCLLGEDSFGYALSTIDGRMVGKKQVELFYLDAPEQATGCDILFVSDSESEHLKTIGSVLQGSPVLTVSDIPGYADSTGIIEFVRKGNRVSFRINLKNARREGFEINSSLLTLASEVVQ